MKNRCTLVDGFVCNPAPGFWQLLLSDHSLEGYADLEKLLAGCEIIAALDDLDLMPHPFRPASTVSRVAH